MVYLCIWAISVLMNIGCNRKNGTNTGIFQQKAHFSIKFWNTASRPKIKIQKPVITKYQKKKSNGSKKKKKQ